jgi:hypothetical protein
MTALRVSTLLLVLAVASLGASSGRAAQPQLPLRVLFIGNSQTSTNDLPAFVAALAKRAKARPIEYRMVAPSATTLEGHWTKTIAVPALTGHQWDAVVLQQGPSLLPGSRAKLCDYTKRFADAARERGARPFLMMVWPRGRGDFDGVADSYTAAADAADVKLLPAGAAWEAAWRRNPDLALHPQSDEIHPSDLGTFLAALVVDAGMRGVRPALVSSLVVDGSLFWIPRATARVLRDAATEALTRSFRPSACA